MTIEREYTINEATYKWSVSAFNLVRKALRVNIKMHYDHNQVEDGEIFLFNHFARFETFIPQYLIYRECGAYSRSVAAAQFFGDGDDTFTNYLASVGGLPNDHPQLFSILAEDILKGRKIVMFPEGGMVKDRQVVNEQGDYSIYSRRALQRRKHHSGAAVLATGVEALRSAIRIARSNGDEAKIERFAKKLDMEPAALVSAAHRPTTIIPASITFYPLRFSDNFLRRGVELFNKGVSKRASEELLIEGNILLKNTDMDIRLGEALVPSTRWHWWERRVVKYLAHNAEEIDEFFALETFTGRLSKKLLSLGMRRSVDSLRDTHMRRMYRAVTINLSHLASALVMRLIDDGRTTIDKVTYHRMLYAMVKRVQRETGMYLHRGIANPRTYEGLLGDGTTALTSFVTRAERAGLLESDVGQYRFLEKLQAEHQFDEIRLENPIAVYANEAAPIAAVGRAIEGAIRETEVLSARDYANFRWSDEELRYQWDYDYFQKPYYAELNQQQTAIESGKPYLLLPERPRSLGVVLVHGFLASPAELRAFAEQLQSSGYPALGVRLEGHGTSPWDLRDRSWEDWLDSVRRGVAIMADITDQVALVGFSTGAALALLQAADSDTPIAGVAATAAPLRYRNRNMMFVPLVHGANKVVRWVSSTEGVMPFRPTNAAHPNINYAHMPIRGLYELRQMSDTLKAKLGQITCPTHLVQATHDTVVDPHSAEILYEGIGASAKTLVTIETDRHGVLYEDLGNARASIEQFLADLQDSMHAAAA